MKIIRANHLGMCFGVRDAISMALEHSTRQKLTILGELVHNETVNHSLRQEGIEIKHNLQEVNTSMVMITAHGASDAKMQRVREQGFQIIEATCPLVHFAHRALRELVQSGCHPIIIGKRNHVEVNGMTEDLVEYDVILADEDVLQLQERPSFGIVSQTTQPIERVHHLICRIQERFPKSDLHFRDTVCQPTKQRQTAAVELAIQCDVILVIGGNQSNNTQELADTCRRHCNRVHQIQNATELKPFWFYNSTTVGITAGTSTPDTIIDLVEQRLSEIMTDSRQIRITCPS